MKWSRDITMPACSHVGVGGVNDYLNYYDVELDGYAFGNTTTVPSFYHVMDDSNYTNFGTSFTHIFNDQTFDFTSFNDSMSQKGNKGYVEYIIIDSISFKLGHVNHSGLNNTLIVSLKTLPIGDDPSPVESDKWYTLIKLEEPRSYC